MVNYQQFMMELMTSSKELKFIFSRVIKVSQWCLIRTYILVETGA